MSDGKYGFDDPNDPSNWRRRIVRAILGRVFVGTMPELRLRDRILHATAGWHTTTDPVCINYRAPKPGSRLDRASRGRDCNVCMAAVWIRPEPRTAVICPECQQSIVVPIAVTLFDDEVGAYMEATPDLTDLWAHVWTHDGGDDE